MCVCVCAAVIQFGNIIKALLLTKILSCARYVKQKVMCVLFVRLTCRPRSLVLPFALCVLLLLLAFVCVCVLCVVKVCLAVVR